MGFLSRLFGRRSDRPEADPVLKAALTGDAGMARSALDGGASPDGENPSAPPPLVLALAKGHDEVAEILISAGADVRRADPGRGMAALHLAAMHGKGRLVQLLIDRGADLEATFGQPPLTALALAYRMGQRDVVHLLLQAGASPNVSIDSPDAPAEEAGVTPLFHAASTGDVSMLQLLAKHGADLNAWKSDGLTPLMGAAFRGQAEAVRALVEAGAKMNLIHGADPARPFSALDLAEVRGHQEIVDFLKARGAVSTTRT
jgi:ankyrin repeat protein